MKGLAFTLEVGASDTIQMVKAKISKMHQDHQQLLFNGQELENRQILSDYHIGHEDTLHLVWLVEKGMGIFLESDTGERITLEVDASDTVESVKAQIQPTIQPDQLKILSKKEVLEDGRTLSDYNIQTGSLLWIFTRRKGKDTFHILAIRITGETYCLEVQPSDTIKKLIDILNYKHRLFGPIDLSISFNGKTMKDEWTLKECNIEMVSVIHAVLRLRGGGTSLQVETPAYEKHRLIVDMQATTIGELKVRMQDREGIPSSQQLLIFNNRQLENERTLSDSNIQHFNTLQLLSLRGGE